MKNTLILLLRSLYLIRRLDSLFCVISFAIAAIVVVGQEFVPLLGKNRWFIIFPVLYLFNEALLLFLYHKIKTMTKKNEIDYFKVNRNRLIIPRIKAQRRIVVGNLTHFLNFFPYFADLKILIIYKLIGLNIALLFLMSLLYANLGLASLIMIGLAGLLMAIKLETNKTEKKLTF